MGRRGFPAIFLFPYHSPTLLLICMPGSPPAPLHVILLLPPRPGVPEEEEE